MRFAACLPLAVLHAAGWLLGWLMYLASPRYRAHLAENLAIAGLGGDAAVRREAPSDRDTYAKIQAIIAAEAASIKAKKDRLAAVIASIKNRFKG